MEQGNVSNLSRGVGGADFVARIRCTYSTRSHIVPDEDIDNIAHLEVDPERKSPSLLYNSHGDRCRLDDIRHPRPRATMRAA